MYNKQSVDNQINGALANQRTFRYITGRSGTNIDVIQDDTESKTYFQLLSNDSSGTKPDDINSAIVQTLRWDSNYAVQIAYEMTMWHRTYIRYLNKGVWQNWEKIPQQHNLTDAIANFQTKIETVTINIGDFTIGSNGYTVLKNVLQADDSRRIIGWSVNKWTSNTGAFNIITYYNKLCYAIGTPDVKVKGLIVDFYVTDSSQGR